MDLPPNARTLDRLVQERGLVRGAELGVRRGELTASLLERHPGLSMIAVDLWAPHPTFTERYDHEGDLRRFRENVRDFEARVTVLRLLTTEAARHVADGSLDFVFVEATHTYAALASDLDAWLPKLRPGGLVSGHDYHPHWDDGGVMRCVDERLPTRWLADDSCWFAWTQGAP